jgi:exosortase
MTQLATNLLRVPSNSSRWLLSLGILLAIIYAYRAIVWDLIVVWTTDENYSHGFLVPALSLFIIWKRREELKAQTICPHSLGLFVLGVGSTLLLLGSVMAGAYLERVSLIVMITGLVLLNFGIDITKVLLFPLALLLFMIPFPSLLLDRTTLPLQLFSAKLAATSLFEFGIPVLRMGNILTLPNLTLEVVEACSGIRSIQALATLSLAYAYFFYEGPWSKVAFLILSVPVAVIANAIRIIGSAVVGYHFGPDKAESFYHFFTGWFVFLIAFSFLVLVGRTWLSVGNTLLPRLVGVPKFRGQE